MARNTSKNAEMQQHPELMKAMKGRNVRRAVAGGGSSAPGQKEYFEMVSSPAGGGQVIARAIHYDDKGVNDLPDDAVVVNVFKQYALIEFGGPCKHVIFRRSELKPFDVSLYSRAGKENKDERRTENQAEVSRRSEGQDGAEPAR